MSQLIGKKLECLPDGVYWYNANNDTYCPYIECLPCGVYIYRITNIKGIKTLLKFISNGTFMKEIFDVNVGTAHD